MKSFLHESYLNFRKHLRTLFSSYIQTVDYKGVKLFYSRGTSIIEPLINRRTGTSETYEPEISSILIAGLKSKKQAGFIDVGANIGLTSLNVFSEIKGINIYAFEPGPHQYSLFKRTIEENGLNTIHLSSFALSEKEGLADFVVHSSEHASGDGFVDTGRAGKGNTIQVRTITLDSWWEKNRKPSIAAIKIDAEGSEFWILKGAQALIEKERPLILMEFYPPHFANYPFSELDVLHWFAKFGYEVFSVDHNQKITADNFMNYKDELRDIIARPTDSANTEQSRPLSV